MNKILILALLVLSGCATTNTKELEARIDTLESVTALLIKAHDETASVVSGNAKITNEQSEIINNNADILKSAIEVMKLHDADIEELKKQNNETHF
ncbi:MAG: hypothetical protein WC465_05035 [Patescibacteria group bacterium]